LAASTPVATPSGERAIGSPKNGDTVLAYNPTTDMSEPEPVPMSSSTTTTIGSKCN